MTLKRSPMIGPNSQTIISSQAEPVSALPAGKEYSTAPVPASAGIIMPIQAYSAAIKAMEGMAGFLQTYFAQFT